MRHILLSDIKSLKTVHKNLTFEKWPLLILFHIEIYNSKYYLNFCYIHIQ